METACFSETSASTCKYTQRQNQRPPQQQDDNRHESPKSHLVNNLFVVGFALMCCEINELFGDAAQTLYFLQLSKAD
jgi:hypothetical protein